MRILKLGYQLSLLIRYEFTASRLKIKDIHSNQILVIILEVEVMGAHFFATIVAVF